MEIKIYTFTWNDRVLRLEGQSLSQLELHVPTYYRLFTITKK